MVKILADSDLGYQYKITRLTKTILGADRPNQYETVLLSEGSFDNLLGPYFDGIIDSIYTIFRQRSVFSLNERALDMPTAIRTLIPRIAKYLYAEGNHHTTTNFYN